MSGEASIQVERLDLWYGAFQALKGVTLEVPARGVTALIGPSGCGKTTLLRCFNRLVEGTAGVRRSGRIALLGHDIFAPDVSLASLRRQVGMVFQRPNPLPLSVRENVLFGLRTHLPRSALSAARLDEAVESSLRAVALWDSAKDALDQHAGGLSLEQQQKLCIARLLPLKPEVLLMDEPCSALDAEGTAKIEALIAGLRDAYAIVIVTHSLAQARRVSARCAYMLLGELVEYRDTEQLFAAPKDPRTALYVGGGFA
jgi:phosphate transport system ATP-binding protein